MKFALDLPVHSHYSDPKLLLDLALEAEAAGWDGYFLWDHINWSGKAPKLTDPWIVLGAIAAQTERIRLGTMITPLSRRRPWKVARETVALDRLSDGRLILGVGLGAWPGLEFAKLGDEADPVIRAERLDESLALLDAFWSGEKVQFQGKHFQIDGITFRPTPVQKPRIPIWVGGYWPSKRPMRRAARWDGAFPLQSGTGFKDMMPPEKVAEVAAYLGQHRQGNAPFDLVHWGHSTGDAEVDRPVIQAYAKVGVTWWLENIYPGRGSVKQIRERIRRGPPRSDDG